MIAAAGLVNVHEQRHCRNYRWVPDLTFVGNIKLNSPLSLHTFPQKTIVAFE